MQAIEAPVNEVDGKKICMQGTMALVVCKKTAMQVAQPLTCVGLMARKLLCKAWSSH